MGIISKEIKAKLHKTFKQSLPVCDLRVVFKISTGLKNYFNFKDKIKRDLLFLIIYNFQIKRHYRTQTTEQNDVSPIIRKYVKKDSLKSAVRDHTLF